MQRGRESRGPQKGQKGQRGGGAGHHHNNKPTSSSASTASIATKKAVSQPPTKPVGTKHERLWKNIQDDSRREELLKQQHFDAAAWKAWFDYYSALGDRTSVRAMRILVQEGTFQTCQQLRYFLPSSTFSAASTEPKEQKGDEESEENEGEEVEEGTKKPTRATVSLLPSREALLQQVRSNKWYEFDATGRDVPGGLKSFAAVRGQHIRRKRWQRTSVEVVQGDCIEAALELKLGRGMRPAVLNMASYRRPGGGYRNGAGAQEENLFRRSNYYQSLEDPEGLDKGRKWHYPLPEFGGIYSPQVVVFRAAEDKGYAYLPEPVPLDFIAVAAYARPSLEGGKKQKTFGKDQEPRMTSKLAEATKNKIRTILAIALDNDHDSLVLSAFGCGAYGNPPGHMARLFHNVIRKEFNGYFKHITFAIFDDHNSRKAHNPRGNVIPFQEIFPKETNMFDDEPELQPPTKKTNEKEKEQEEEEEQEKASKGASSSS
ncbi:DUF2263 domain-containing protein [Balamuthia mandrillaris]